MLEAGCQKWGQPDAELNRGASDQFARRSADGLGLAAFGPRGWVSEVWKRGEEHDARESGTEFRVELRAGNGAESCFGPVEWAGQIGPDCDQPAAHIFFHPFFHPFFLSTSNRADLRVHQGAGLPAGLNLDLNLSLSFCLNLSPNLSLNLTLPEAFPETGFETFSLTCLPASRAALLKALQADEHVGLDLDVPGPVRLPGVELVQNISVSATSAYILLGRARSSQCIAASTQERKRRVAERGVVSFR